MTEARTVFILVHTGRAGAAKIAAEFSIALREAGIGIRTLNDDLESLRDAGLDDVEGVDAAPGAALGCELAVVFGGDGTILRGAELCRGAKTPIVGVNLGHVGFLAEADVEDLHELVDGVVNRTYKVEERLTIDVAVRVAGKVVSRTWALNEAAVEKASRERMLEVVVEIDDRPLSRWGCDGVVCATPTGSTAYNFSAGGPIVWPELAALLMVPISAHALFARPLVVSPDSKLAIEVVASAPAHGVLWCDGRRADDLPPGARVEVTRGHEPVLLARLKTAPFTDRLVRKFDLSVAGWRGVAERRLGEAAAEQAAADAAEA
ncbi:NAD kinase [soil metagenome]